MRYFKVFGTIASLIILSLTSCQHFSAREAVKVNDEVIQYQKSLMSALQDFVTALEQKDKAPINTTLEHLKKVSGEGIDQISQIEDPDCSATFVPAAKALFEHYRKASENEYRTIADWYIADSITHESYDSLKTLVDKFKLEQAQVNEAFISAQKDFARDCGFKLVRNAE